MTPQAEQPGFPIVGVGASAGGLEAFTELLSNLPDDCGLAIVYVQHLHPTHESLLPELLRRVSHLPIAKIEDGVAIERNHVYVLPPGQQVELIDRKLHLHPRTGQARDNMPIDVLFRSLAHSEKNQAVAVVLSGGGSDGALGVEAVKAEGGIVFAQDGSAIHDSMPRMAIATGCVDHILPPKEIAGGLRSLVQHPYTAMSSATPQPLLPGGGLPTVLELLRRRTGTDFRLYKVNTVSRRILRRMARHNIERLDAYVALLESHPQEIDALHNELLIRFTSFFRDANVFERLKEQVFPLMAEEGRNHPIRFWVPGCATGEEAYSLAISLLEFLGDTRRNLAVKIFATDISEDAVTRARSGQYIENIELDVSPERLRRFFVRTDGSYQVNKLLRDICIFARQDLIQDPPFSNIDLVSCRNVLIYLDAALQRRIVPMFHYALRSPGFLLLGKAEMIGGPDGLFEAENKEIKLFVKRPRTHAVYDFPAGRPTFRQEPRPDAAVAAVGDGLQPVPASPELPKQIERYLVNTYAPVGVVINDRMDVLQFRGDTSPYLMPPRGTASFHILKMAREGLLVDLRGAVEQAKREGRPFRHGGIKIKHDGELRDTAIEVVPFGTTEAGRQFLILFSPDGEERRETPKTPSKEPPVTAETAEQEVLRLRKELSATQEYLQGIIEEHEAANQQLQAANEEILSTNEEFQSINEELETSKEELQSSNEELHTLNEELGRKNADLDRLNSDFLNLIGASNLPVLIFGADQRLRRFTPAAATLHNLAAGDIGRPMGHVKLELLREMDLERITATVLETLTPAAVTIQSADGIWYEVTIRPYRTSDNKLDGVTLVFTNIDLVKRSEIRYQQLYQKGIESSQDAILLFDPRTGEGVAANPAARSYLGYDPREIVGKPFWTIEGLKVLAGTREGFAEFLKQPFPFHQNHMLAGQDGGEKRFDLIAVIYPAGDRDILQLGFRNVTEMRRIERELGRSEERARRLVESNLIGIAFTRMDGVALDANDAFLGLFGFTREDLRAGAVSLNAMTIPEHRERDEQALVQLRQSGVCGVYEKECSRRDGARVWVLAGAAVIGADEVITFSLDLTARHRMEEKLRQSQRLESVGLLAGGIAHDFNNILTGILGNASLALTSVTPAHPLYRMLESIMHASERAADLTRQLLAYAGKGRFEVVPLNLSAHIREIASLLESSIPRTVQLELDLAKDLPAVEADPGQIQQVIMNLMLNAAEAIGDLTTGVVRVVTCARDAGAEYLSRHFPGEDVKPGKFVEVEIQDTGVGMDEATQARIFDPFFSTKFTGRGLGLAAVLGIVRGHHGAIRVTSSLGNGTTFNVLFPAGVAQSLPPVAPRAAAELRGSGTILVVDDEAIVRQVATRILEGYGYKVFAAENGAAAVELFRANAGAIDLVVLDLAMPVMSGEETWDRLREIRADVAVLLSSGYSEMEAVARFRGKQLAGFVQKPFKVEVLAQKVKTILQPADHSASAQDDNFNPG